METTNTDVHLSKFKALVEHSGSAIAISSPDGKLVYINPAHEQLFGRSFDEAKNLNYRDYYPEESIEYLNREAIPQIIHGKAWTGTCVAFGAAGSRLHLQHKSGSIFDDAGNATYTFAIMNDVSDKVRYQEDIEAKTVELDCKTVRLKEEIENHKETIAKLEVTMKEIKILRGIIPICMHCKGIRDDKGYWNRIEKYISEHSEAQFSHSICEECLEKHYPDETE